MADYPIEELGGLTPLQAAHTPNMDSIASSGVTGMVKTFPEGYPTGSDVANLSVMGYSPKLHYTGRSPLEAVGMGIELDPKDVTFRCNLVTLSDHIVYENKTMLDYSSDEISSAEAAELINIINKNLSGNRMAFYPGVSYRHCLVWKDGPMEFEPSPLIPPHDIFGKKIKDYLPNGRNGQVLKDMMERSSIILPEHPVNKKRIEKGLNPATSIWLWGEGTKPELPQFFNKYGLKGAVISAVDLLKGIGRCAGLKVVNVEGSTANVNTDFKAEADAALNELKNGIDFVYLHIEAPDECGHRNELKNKVKSIEFIDNLVVGPILKELEVIGDYSIMVLPDHPTPLSLRTHTSEPVPFAYKSSNYRHNGKSINKYDEISVKESEIFIEEGYKLMDCFIQGKFNGE